MSSALRTYQGVSPQLGERVYIDPASVVIGNVTLGDDCSVWPMTVIRGVRFDSIFGTFRFKVILPSTSPQGG